MSPSTRVVSLQTALRANTASGDGTLVIAELHRGGPLYDGLARFVYSSGKWLFSLRQLNGTWITSTPVAFALSTWHQVQLSYDASGAQPLLRASIDGGTPIVITDTSVGTL